MKKVYQQTLFLLMCIGLASCGANSMFEAETMGAVELTRASDDSSVPEGCTSWFDGCNTCRVTNGQLGACTKMACKAQEAEPMCKTYAPGFGESKAAVEATAPENGDTPAPDTIPETKRTAGAEVPESCKIWFDGCNSCVVMGGKLRGCTSKVCKSPGPASCLK